MELTVKDVLKMENIMNKVKDVVSNSVTITDHKSAGSIRLTECTMREFEGFDICYLADNKEEAGNYLGSFFIENADSDKPKMVYYEDAYEEKGKKEIPLYEANENPTISYENYQLQWMMDHGYSLQDLMRSMDEYYAGKDISNREIEDLFNEWQDEYGFHYELWACDGEAECMDYHSNLSLNEQKRYEELSEIGDNYANLHCRNENGKEDTYNWKIIERENVK